MNISYQILLNNIEAFASSHLQIKKFSSDFPEQLPNFATEDEAYPVLFVSPTNSVFDLNTTIFEVTVYCFDIIQKDRANINTILSDTNSILSDLDIWLRDDSVIGVDVVSTSTVIPINNALLDYAAGWEMTLTVDVSKYGACEIPFSTPPVVVSEINNIVYSPFLTCDSLATCDTFTNAIDNLQNEINDIVNDVSQNTQDIIALSAQTDNTISSFTYDDLNTLTITDSLGNNFSASINQMSGLTINGSLSATTYFGLPQDVFLTGGTYDSSTGVATFQNNAGSSFNVSGFFTGATVPNEVVFFDTTDPNTFGTIFDPDTPALTDTLYVSSVDSNTWTYSGSSYSTYTASTINATEFNLNGTNIDAGSNKTAHISRSGSLTIGGTGQTTDKFSVFTTGGTKSLVVDVNGSVYNRGTGNISTNTAFGQNTLRDNTTGNGNTAYGNNSLINNTTANNNTAIGSSVLRVNNGTTNTGVGFRSLYLNTDGANNTAIGGSAMRLNISGSSNVAIGVNALYDNTTASNNVAIGVNSLLGNTTGSSNTAIGTNALYNNTTASNNTAIGFESLRFNTTGTQNTAVGTQALRANITGSTNTAIGFQSMYNNKAGANTAIGRYSLYTNTTGTLNNAIGLETLFSNTTGNNNTATGYRALFSNTTGSNNTADGYGALYDNTTGANNTSIGYQSLYLNISGASNTAIGVQALTSNLASNNTAVGYRALYVSTAANNTAFGFGAGVNVTTGTYNILIGPNAGVGLTTGNYNTIIGGVAVPSGLTSSLVLADGLGAIKLSADSANKLFIPTAPSTGDTSDSLLVRTSTGEIKTVTQSSISNSGATAGSIALIIDGGGVTPSTGQKGSFITIPYSGTITGWDIFGNVSGSCVVDVWKCDYTSFPPTIANTITASAKPTLTSAQKNTNSILTGWTTTVTAGDIFAFNLESASTLTNINVILKITKS